MEEMIATVGVFFFFAFLVIGLFAVVGFFAVVIRTGNTVRELQKLNKEFNKYFRWMYEKEQKNKVSS